MSEFVRTMRNWRRMCDTFIDQYGADCGKHCPLYYLDTCGAIREVGNGTYDNIAETVNAWAAENLEPVYPTYLEWLIDIGVFCSRPMYSIIADKIATTHIPADIAEKLGLKPIGGENDV